MKLLSDDNPVSKGFNTLCLHCRQKNELAHFPVLLTKKSSVTVMDDCETNGNRQPVVLTPHVYVSCYSKMNADKRVESPNPILPLSTPDIEAEKLIKTKDEEVSVKNTTL